MSACCRKSSQPREEVEAEEKESPVFETSKITFDQYGNLIYEHEKTEPFDHKKELRTIAELEPGDAKAEGLTWYLMDAPWVESWLNFAYLCPSVAPIYKKGTIVKISDNDFAPRPGPCINKRLIEFKEGKWLCKKYLAMTNELRGGDYRRVTKETWDAFVKLYPGSGPAITMVYNYDVKCHSSGYYPTEEFIIIDPPPNPYPKENASIFSWFSTKVSGSEAVITNPLHEVDDGAEDKGTEVRSVVGVVPDEVDFSLKSVETTPLRPVRNDLREKYGVTPERPLSTTINPHPTDITPKLSTNAPHVDSSNSIPPPLSTISFSTNAADSKDDDMMLTDRSYISSAANPRPRDLNDKLLADQEARQKLLSVKQQNFQSAISMRSFTSSAASKR